MPRRTREEKIIADLRRQLQEHQPVSPARVEKRVVAPTPAAVTLPEITVAPADTVEPRSRSYLKGDLLKVSALIGSAVALELIFSFLVSTGALKSLGFS